MWGGSIYIPGVRLKHMIKHCKCQRAWIAFEHDCHSVRYSVSADKTVSNLVASLVFKVTFKHGGDIPGEHFWWWYVASLVEQVVATVGVLGGGAYHAALEPTTLKVNVKARDYQWSLNIRHILTVLPTFCKIMLKIWGFCHFRFLTLPAGRTHYGVWVVCNISVINHSLQCVPCGKQYLVFHSYRENLLWFYYPNFVKGVYDVKVCMHVSSDIILVYHYRHFEPVKA